MLIVSMDGPAPLHDSMRILPGGGGTWHLVAEALRTAAGEGLEFGISLVMREHNVDHATEIFEQLYDEFHPASFGVNMLHYTGRDFAPPSAGRCTGMLLEAFRFARRKGVFVDQVARRLTPLVLGKPRTRDCEALSGKRVVFPDGTVSCCVNWLGIPEPPPSWTRRIPLLSAECAGCPAISICGGGCAWDGENLFGPGRMDRRNCVWTLAFLEEALLDIGTSLPGRSPAPDEMLAAYGALISRPGTIRSSIGHSS
jgi:radical SAM protein with 4Fe4S-binding SPASM domain